MAGNQTRIDDPVAWKRRIEEQNRKREEDDQKLAQIFATNPSCGPPRCSQTTPPKADRKVMLEVVDLLERRPRLASKLYKCSRTCTCASPERCGNNTRWSSVSRSYEWLDESLTPLGMFVHNNFDVRYLEMIWNMYPEAVSSPQSKHPSLLHMACSLKCVSDDTLLWVLSKSDTKVVHLQNDQPPGRRTAFEELFFTKNAAASTDLINAFLLMDGFKKNDIRFHLLEYLLRYGYDWYTLDYFERKIAQLVEMPSFLHELTIDTESHNLSISHVMVLKRILPHLKKISCGNNMELCGNGWENLFEALIACKNLDVTLTLPIDSLLVRPTLLAALSDLLKTKPRQMLLSVIISGYESQYNHTPYKIFEAIEKATKSNLQNGPVIESLEIQGMEAVGWDLLKRVSRCASRLVLQNTAISFGGDGIKDAEVDKYSFFPFLKRILLEFIQTDQASIYIDRLCVGFSYEGRRPEQKSQVQKLIRLEFEHEDDYMFEEPLDATAAFVELLNIASLKHLIFKTDNSSHQVQLEPFSQALTRNRSLVVLKLKDLGFSGDGLRSFPSVLLEFAEKNSNLTDLHVADHYCSERIYTVLDGHDWKCDDFSVAKQIQHALWRRVYGCSQLRADTTSTSRVVELLDTAMKDRAPKESSATNIVKKISLQNELEPAKQLDSVYKLLKVSTATWCSAALGQGPADTLSILYSILREVPDAWCFGFPKEVEVHPRFGGRKRKRNSGMMPLSFFFKPMSGTK